MISNKFTTKQVTSYVVGMTLWLMTCATTQAQLVPSDSAKQVNIGHGTKGFEFRTRDDRFLLQIQGRLQFRFATPEDQDPGLYRPNSEARENRERETSLPFNWFFNGHQNKLTFETSYFNYVKIDLQPTDEWRFRLQWDISL
ncbi:MAG TPA: hypothetical protein VK658_23845 [Chryseolinea sp.]|nr:hypothetical protein [Chryseolinea sp.]